MFICVQSLVMANEFTQELACKYMNHLLRAYRQEFLLDCTGRENKCYQLLSFSKRLCSLFPTLVNPFDSE